MIPLLAVPVIHSSGVWIASTAASGYLAGTLSTTWLGAFVLGNGSLLSGLGLVSAAGITGASIAGGLSAAGTAVTATTGTVLTAIGLGGLASKLGVTSVATFLGVTPIGWAVIGSVSTLFGSYAFLKMRGGIKLINEERVKGGLEPTSWKKIAEDIVRLESESMQGVLDMLAAENQRVSVSNDKNHALIDGDYYPVKRLKYVIEEDGSELIKFIPRLGKARTVFVVKASGT